MSKGYVYLLTSVQTGRYYLGWTIDMQRRLGEHQAGLSSYTKSRGPWALVGYEVHATAEQAKCRERQLKRNPNMQRQFKKRLLTKMFQPAVGGRRQVVG